MMKTPIFYQGPNGEDGRGRIVTPEEISPINRETFEARAEKLRRLLERHPSGWTAADARFYAEHLEAMEQTPEHARQMVRDAAELLAFQNDYPKQIVSAQNRENRLNQERPEKAFTACIRGEVEKDPKISAKACQ
jgi:hypothetical protein